MKKDKISLREITEHPNLSLSPKDYIDMKLPTLGMYKYTVEGGIEQTLVLITAEHPQDPNTVYARLLEQLSTGEFVFGGHKAVKLKQITLLWECTFSTTITTLNFKK